MSAAHVEFGFLPLHLELTNTKIQIETLETMKDHLRRLQQSEHHSDGWIYAPSARRIFGLPKTHILTLPSAGSKARCEFLIWALSLFTGMRLTTTEAGFIDATPIKRKLTDLFITPAELEICLESAYDFWDLHIEEPSICGSIQASIHSLYISQNPELLGFEKFLYACIALDSCWPIYKHIYHSPAKLKFNERIGFICSASNIILPDWARFSGKYSEFSKFRNDLVHEGISELQPMGFETKSVIRMSEIAFEIRAFVCRILIAVLGIPAHHYLGSPVNTRQVFALE